MTRFEPFLINPHRGGRRRKAGRRIHKRKMSALQLKYFGPRAARRRVARRRKKNPLGEEIVIVGNPRRRRVRRGVYKLKRRGVVKMARRRRRVRVSRRRRRSARRSRGVISMNPRRYRRRRRSGGRMRRNAFLNVRHRRRRGRRNPAVGAIGGLSWRRPMTLVPVLVTGGLSAAVTVAAPNLLNRFVPAGIPRGPLFTYGSQLLSAFGGGWLISRFLGRTHGAVWTIVGVAVVGGGILNQFVLGPSGLLSAYPEEYGMLAGGSPEEQLQHGLTESFEDVM